MIQPEALKKDEPLKWSSGRGTDVWALFRACIDGDLERVKGLLAKDPSLARCQHAYRKPLYFAVREDRLDVAAFLLDHDPDPTGLAANDSLLEIARDRGHAAMESLLETKLAERHGISRRGEPVAAAIRERDLPKVRALLDASPELLRAGDLRSNRPIHWATMTRQADLIDELLERGADIDARRHDGARPLHLTNGDYHYRGWRDVPTGCPATPQDIYRHLVRRGATVDLGMACATGDLDRVRELLDGDPSRVNRVSDYAGYYVGCGAPIKNAAAGGHLEIVRLLLERGANPNLPEEGIAPDGHALHSAVVRGHIEIVRLLLDHGAHPNVEVESSADTLSAALATAGYSYTSPNAEMVELLCSHGASRAVHLLAYSGDVLTAAAVFAANPALANDPEALANAASEGHEAFVRLMLRYEPDLPRRVDFPGWAVGAKTRELNELLFRHGMNPSAPDWLGITPLHHLARRGDVEKAALFLDHGADLDARDEDIRSTPLGWAAKFGQTAMVKLLLERGAKPTLPDDPPWATPLAWATRRNHPEVVEVLRSHGARTGWAPPD
jgi:ankyrin repeat protein